MDFLFQPGKIGSLELSNRLVRSATAERMADREGRPKKELKQLYQQLAQGGVGLIITGHMFVHPSGKAHDEMTGIYGDELTPALAVLAETVHQSEAKIVAQINHGGLQCSDEAVSERIAPSEVTSPTSNQQAREINQDEILDLIDAYAQAARRAQEAGFDGVQVHAAHGYLINQFLSPAINHRTDQWGGNIHNRMRFLKQVAKLIRQQVGPDYPMLIKLGMMDGVEGGLTLEESIQVVTALVDMDFDAVEISGGIGGRSINNVRKGIRSESEEAYFLPLAQQACRATQLPILLVGGLRSKSIMEKILEDGHADFISLCRPLISEPNLPNLLRMGIRDKSRCLSANNCWPIQEDEGIACKCPHDR